VDLDGVGSIPPQTDGSFVQLEPRTLVAALDDE